MLNHKLQTEFDLDLQPTTNQGNCWNVFIFSAFLVPVVLVALTFIFGRLRMCLTSEIFRIL